MQEKRRKFLKQLASIGGMAGLSGVSSISNANAAKAEVQDIRLFRHEGYVRLVLDLDQSVQHSIFTLHQPERVVLDIKQVRMTHGLVDRVQANSLIKGIRSGVQNGDDLRIVFDLNDTVIPRSFHLAPTDSSGHRLVLDLHDTEIPVKKTEVKKQALRDVIIVIDPGHGGKDPGATGKTGVKEKTITLQIARRLQKAINSQKGMTAVLTRNDDRFLRLRERISTAKKNNADMMISLHADSFPDPRAGGSSIYALSVDGASSETARLLADKENSADLLFGDVSLDIEDEMVKEVLLDLSLTGTIQSSLDIGDVVLNEVRSVNKVHKKKVQQAGFAVLKAPNIPAILIEMAFISNPREERNLKSSAHQEKVAKAIGRGVNQYFSRKAPPGTWLSESAADYKVRTGDTLGSIAENFNTSVSNLRARNALSSNSLFAGQELKIPAS